MDIFVAASPESSSVYVFLDGKLQGSFTSRRKADIFIEGLSKSDKVVDETHRSGLVSQKNDEVKSKRRGRKKKADNDRGKLSRLCA